MKEIIKDLADRVFKEAKETKDFVNFEKFQEKFAQLIVQECISVSENHAKDLESQPSDPEFKYYDEAIVNGIYEATAAIKEHFSIK